MNPKDQTAVAPLISLTERVTPIRTLPGRTPGRAAESTVQDQCRRLAEWLAAWREFLAVNDAILTEADVTPREFAAMLEVDRSDHANGPTIGMLAERLCTRHNTTVGLVTRMCKKGYVRRMRDARDRRHAHVQLTEKGRQTLVALVRAHDQESGEARRGLAPATAV